MGSPQEEKVLQRERKKRARLQLLLYLLDEWFETTEGDKMRMISVTIRTGLDRGGEPLVILKAEADARRFVAFHSAETAEDALRGALERVKNEHAKWREETPYKPSEG